MSGLSQDTYEKIEKKVLEVSEREGCRLYDIEFVGSGRARVLRIFIDKQGGASIDDCANVSRGVNQLLDEEDLIPGDAYQLEVSTPGLERQLKKAWHFEGALGQPVEVKLVKPLSEFGVTETRWLAAKKFSGRLQAFAEGVAEVAVDDGPVAMLPMDAFEKIKTIFEVVAQPKKKK